MVWSSITLHIGLTCCKSDPSLFILKNDDILVLMLIYVDDIILTGNNAMFTQSLISKLGLEFSLKDLGSFKLLLGYRSTTMF